MYYILCLINNLHLNILTNIVMNVFLLHYSHLNVFIIQGSNRYLLLIVKKLIY